MNLNPQAGCEGYVECEWALELNGHQVLFECEHGKYQYLGDRVSPQVEHVYPPITTPTSPCHTVGWLNFWLMKRLLGLVMATLLQEQKEIILTLSEIICKVAWLDEKIPSPHYAGSSSSYFTKTYPPFSAWQYDVMNPNGTYSSMPLTRPEHVPNVPWPNPVCS